MTEGNGANPKDIGRAPRRDYSNSAGLENEADTGYSFAMRKLCLALALAWPALPSTARAQDEEAPPAAEQEQAPAPRADEADRQPTIEDARINIGGIIQAFIDQRSPEGYWPLRDKRSKRVRRLKLTRVEDDKVKDEGKMRFSAPAVLTDTENEGTVRAVFIVSFRGPEWRVVGMRLIAPGSGSSRARREP
jgi:hypothetical protein